jgi:hypothetical protein
MAKSTKRIVFGTENPSTLRIPWLSFFRDFPSVVRQMPGYKIMQRRGTARIPPPPGVEASPKRLESRTLQSATMREMSVSITRLVWQTGWQLMTRYETHWYRMANKECSAIYSWLQGITTPMTRQCGPYAKRNRSDDLWLCLPSSLRLSSGRFGRCWVICVSVVVVMGFEFINSDVTCDSWRLSCISINLWLYVSVGDSLWFCGAFVVGVIFRTDGWR